MAWTFLQCYLTVGVLPYSRCNGGHMGCILVQATAASAPSKTVTADQIEDAHGGDLSHSEAAAAGIQDPAPAEAPTGAEIPLSLEEEAAGTAAARTPECSEATGMGGPPPELSEAAGALRPARTASHRGLPVTASASSRIISQAINTPLFTPDASDVHAEVNAVAGCALRGEATCGATVYITMPPCKNCFAILQVRSHRAIRARLQRTILI